MKRIVDKIEGIKSRLQEVNDPDELVNLAGEVYQMTSQQYIRADRFSTGPSEFKSNFRFKSLHHLEYLVQDGQRIVEETGVDSFRSEVTTALNLVLVVLEDDATMADLSNIA